MDDTSLRHVARRIRDLIEPLAASVYFAPEVHARYEKLGFGAGFVTKNGLHYPDMPAYFTSRAACMGTVPGEVVTAAFGVFPAHVVVPAVAHGWEATTRDEILAARLEGQIAALRNVLGDDPEGAEWATELLRTMAQAGFAAGHHIYAGHRRCGGRTIRSARSSELPTWSVSIEVTHTSRRGRRPASTQSRSASCRTRGWTSL